MLKDGRKFQQDRIPSVVSWNGGMKITSVLSVVPCPIKIYRGSSTKTARKRK